MATFTDPQRARQFDEEAHAQLIQEARTADSTKQAYLLLEAAHVVGQIYFKLHWQTHAHMLGLAWRIRDWPEATGQFIRLALVPLGHLSGRFPLGNPGRANVSAFKSVAVRPELAALFDRARGN